MTLFIRAFTLVLAFSFAAIVAVHNDALVFFGPAVVACTLMACYLYHRSQKSHGDAQECEVVGEDQSRQQKKAEAEKDLQFLAKKLHKAPPYFESAYVRDGKPRWDTVGCNKAHFSREEILACKLKSMSDEKQAEFIVKFR